MGATPMQVHLKVTKMVGSVLKYVHQVQKEKHKCSTLHLYLVKSHKKSVDISGNPPLAKFQVDTLVPLTRIECGSVHLPSKHDLDTVITCWKKAPHIG